MRRQVVALLFPILVLLVSAASGVTPAALAADRLSLSGEVVDLACFIAHDGHGAAHKKCAVECARQGQPVGLLADGGTVYLLVADHNDPAPYQKARALAGEQVTIKGETAAKGGMNSLTVLEVTKK